MQVVAEVTAPVVDTKPAKAVVRPAPKADAKEAKKAPVKAEAAPKESKPKAKPAATKGAPKAAKPSAVAFTLMKGPSAGSLLYAFTDAVLRVTGMDKGKSVPKALLTRILKATAVRYHLSSTMAFEIDAKGDVRLSKGGKAFFAERTGKFSTEDSAKYESILLTGKPNDLCKNKDMINKVA